MKLPLPAPDAYVAERTRAFTGREWVFDAVDSWLGEDDGSRVLVITGRPGSGKTAIAGRIYEWSRGVVPPGRWRHLGPGTLSAAHFCVSVDRAWTDPLTFVHSLAAQLEGHVPGYAHALIEHAGDQRIVIVADQKTGDVHAGAEVTAVRIARLDLGEVQPEAALTAVIRRPLAALASEGRLPPVTLLIDAVDEAALARGGAIPGLVTDLAFLPDPVRVLVTSRPDELLLRGLWRAGAREFPLGSAEHRAAGVDDVARYTAKAVSGPVAERLQGLSAEELVAAVGERSDGNFLVARHLVAMLTDESGEVTAERIRALPTTLDDVYLEFVERAIERTGGGSSDVLPLMGTLAVSQEPVPERVLSRVLGAPAEQVRGLVVGVGQLLDFNESVPASRRSYSLYHRSLADFLLDPDRSSTYWCPAETQRQRVLDAYRPDAGWGAMDWAAADDYALTALAPHALALESPDEGDAVLSPAYLQAKSRRTGPGAILTDVRLGARRAHQAGDIPRLLRWAWLQVGIREQIAHMLIPELLPVLVLAGRAEQALALLGELDVDSASLVNERDEVTRRMATTLAKRGQVDAALGLVKDDGESRAEALADVALAIAYDDPARAVELGREIGNPWKVIGVCGAVATRDEFVPAALELAADCAPAVAAVATTICARDLDRALEIARAAPEWIEASAGDRYHRGPDTVLGQVAAHLASTRFVEALAIVDSIEGPLESGHARIEVIAAGGAAAPDVAFESLLQSREGLTEIALGVGCAFVANASGGAVRHAALRAGSEPLEGLPAEVRRSMGIAARTTDPELLRRLRFERLRDDAAASELARLALDQITGWFLEFEPDFPYDATAVGVVAAALACLDLDAGLRFADAAAARPSARSYVGYRGDVLLQVTRVVARAEPGAISRVLDHMRGTFSHPGYVAAVEELAERDPDRAIEIIRSVSGRASRTSAALVGILAEAGGDAARVGELLALLPRFVDSEVHLSMLAGAGMAIAASMVATDPERAATLAEQIRRRAPEERGEEDAYIRAVALAVPAEEHERAFEIAAGMHQPLARASTLLELVPRADARFNARLLAAAREVPPGLEGADAVFAGVARAVAATDWEAAVELVIEVASMRMAAEAVPAIWEAARPPIDELTRSLDKVVSPEAGLGTVGVFNSAMHALADVVDSDAWSSLVNTLLEIDRALATRVVALGLVTDDPQGAVDLLREGGVPDETLWPEVAVRVAPRDLDVAVELLESAPAKTELSDLIRVVRAISAVDPRRAKVVADRFPWRFEPNRDEAHGAIAVELAAADWPEALGLFDAIPSPRIRASVLAKMATSCPVDGPEPLIALAERARLVSERSPRSVAYGEIIGRMGGVPDVAANVLPNVVFDLGMGDRTTFEELVPRLVGALCALDSDVPAQLEAVLDEVESRLVATEPSWDPGLEVTRGKA